MSTPAQKRFATSVLDSVTDGSVKNRPVFLKTKTGSKRTAFNSAKQRALGFQAKKQFLTGKVGTGARNKKTIAATDAQKSDWQQKDKAFIQETRAGKEMRATRAKGGRPAKDEQGSISTEHLEQKAADWRDVARGPWRTGIPQDH